MKLTASLIALASARKQFNIKPHADTHRDENTVVENCGGTITDGDTVITSPGFGNPGYYYNNLNCEWTIDIPGESDISIVPEHFDIESNSACSYDALNIHEGDSITTTYCGTHEFSRKRRQAGQEKFWYIRSNPMMTRHVVQNGDRIEFTTDSSVVESGFQLRIVTGLGPDGVSCNLSQSGSGTVSSPGFPSEYNNDLSCNFILTADPGQVVKITITDFDVEYHSQCGYDALIIDGTSYCGDNLAGQEIYVDSHETIVQFNTDSSVTETGFRFTWESVASYQEPAIFWNHFTDFYELLKQQMLTGAYPQRVPFLTWSVNRIMVNNPEAQSQLSGECAWRGGPQPTYEDVDIQFFDANLDRCVNLIRFAEMGKSYIESYACMDGHPQPRGTLRRWKQWLNGILDVGRDWCGYNSWEQGPVSLPAGLTCPNPIGQSNRIVGGQVVDRASTWPWIVNIGGCGGSIITQNAEGSDWILTAAHCCEGASQIGVTIGNQNRSQQSVGQFYVDSIQVINHPDFQGGSSLGESYGTGNDICLLEVPNLTDAQPDDCDNCWSPVCLPTEDVAPGRMCYVAGWGTLGSGMAASDELRDVGINIFSNEQCIATAYGAEEIKDNEFCGGVPDLDMDGITDGGRDSCQGDSGGPVVCADGNTAVQYGVVSWGYGCASPNAPGVYARLAGPLTEWINNVINQN